MSRRHQTQTALRRAMLLTTALCVVAAPAHAAKLLFAQGATSEGTPIASGPLLPSQQVETHDGTVQLRLDGGGLISLVGDSAFSLNPDGSVAITRGAITVVNAANAAPVVLHLPGGMTSTVTGESGAASFFVDPRSLDGRVLAGVTTMRNETHYSRHQSKHWKRSDFKSGPDIG